MCYKSSSKITKSNRITQYEQSYCKMDFYAQQHDVDMKQCNHRQDARVYKCGQSNYDI